MAIRISGLPQVDFQAVAEAVAVGQKTTAFLAVAEAVAVGQKAMAFLAVGKKKFGWRPQKIALKIWQNVQKWI